MNEDQLNKKLLESPNPFSGTIVRSPWDESPDVESVNGQLTFTVLDNLTEAQENKYTKMMLIQGQPGVGKTHFLARLRRLSKGKKILFVEIKPISSVTSIFSHIYREIFTSLRIKGDEDYSPMESLISDILSSSLVKALKERRKEKVLPQKITDLILKLEKNPVTILHLIQRDPNTIELLEPLLDIAMKNVEREFPKVDMVLLKVLFKTLDKDLYSEAMRWLRGDDLDEDLLDKLGVSLTITDEQDAQRILQSIMTLTDRPLLLCFDQLETLSELFQDPTVITRFFNVLGRLCNETPNALILLMMQSVVWDEQIRPVLQQSVLDRIEDIKSLNYPTSDEVLELVYKRLNLVWTLFPYQPEMKTYPFTEKYINELSESKGRNPRYVLRQLSKDFQFMKSLKEIKLLDTYTVSDHTKVILKDKDVPEFLENQLNSIVSSYKLRIEDSPYITRENYLEGGILDIFKGMIDKEVKINNYSIKKIKIKQQSKEIDFILDVVSGDGREEKWGLEICNNERWTSINNVLKMIRKNLDNNLYQKWFLIRDTNLRLKKTWVQTGRLYESLKPEGDIFYIEIEDDARLYASKELLDSSSAGDLDLEGKTITRKDVRAYILEKILPNLEVINELFGKKIKTPKPPKTVSKRKNNEPDIKKDILTRLERNSIMNVKKTFKDFDKQQIFYNSVLDELEKENEITVIIRNETQVVISKKGENVF